MRFLGPIERASELAAAEERVRSNSQAGAPFHVTLREPSGIPAVMLELTRRELRDFIDAVRPLGFRLLLLNELEGRAEFALDRRAANEAAGHPRRRRGDRPNEPTPIRPRSAWC